MNSPFTYSWGMVGQLLYSLMPWRMASSSSTFTVTTLLGSTPQAFRIWMARPEKPHIGKLALPFMNSRMSLDLTRASMRCWVSLMGYSLKKRRTKNAVSPRWGGLFHCRPLPAGTARDAGKVIAALHLHKPLGD